MSTPAPIRSSRAYWDAAADTYEQDFTTTVVGQVLRRAVWRELERVFCPGQRVLELNCGTGLDALHLAERGIGVLGCDISQRMIDLARHRASTTEFRDETDFRVLATESIGALVDEGAFDGAFSNFSGLNCVESLSDVRKNLSRLIKPGGSIVLCMLGCFVPWEMIWFMAHGDWGKAIRRFQSRSVSRPQSDLPKVFYRSTREITLLFAPEFSLRSWKGIGIAVPPSYMEHWARRFPKLTNALERADRLLGGVAVFRNLSDFVILEFEHTGTTNGSQ
jgi:ubiquinone/menaquinone biosynthesis C-methylase UbiE